MSVILETSIGDITVDLYVEERPRCSINFLKLCKLKYYNFHLFHTVQQNFVAQTGDPTGTGRGGESVFSRLYGQQARFFEAELKPRIKHSKMGTLSMVNDGNNRHGSQFFITLTEDADFLDKQNHTVFGEVSEGFDILEKLNNAISDEGNRPLKDIRIFHTVVLDDPFPDPSGLAEHIPDSSPVANTQEQLEPRIGADEDTDDEKDMAPEEVEERNKDREARTNAQLLELIGDIPDVDVKPPDNVLFVCKLNPVTTDEDLEVIFSRFGHITGCEVIRNKKTNESLQYAFIEFENAEDCEKAYFKMDNVLIDDRRIHVDFSQSVSKIKWVRDNKEEADEQKPQYKIKDFEKHNDGYEYVFEEPESERLNEKRKKPKREKSHERNHKRKRSTSRDARKRHRSSSHEEKHSPSEEHKQPKGSRGDRRKHPSPSEEVRKRHHSPEDIRKKRGSPDEGTRKKLRSPSEELRKKNTSPSKESRRYHSPEKPKRKCASPSDERRKRQHSPSEDNRRRHCSPSEEDRKKSPSRYRHSDKYRNGKRDRSPEKDHRRRRSSSREESRPRRHRGQKEDEGRHDRREKDHNSRRWWTSDPWVLSLLDHC